MACSELAAAAWEALESSFSGWSMAKVLIVEDQAADVHFAADVVRSLGISDIEARSTATAAKAYLEDASEKHATPEVIVLDLDLGYDNGFEVLRYWHANRGKY